MKILFWLLISIAPEVTCAQVIFANKPADKAVESEAPKPRLNVTFMGQPLDAPTPEKQPMALLKGKSDLAIDQDVSKQIEDSLTFLIVTDSLALITLKLDQIRNSSKMEKRWMLRDVPSILPVRILSWSEFRVSSGFGLRYHPITDKVHNHSGIDLPQPRLTPVYATADGYVDRLVFQPQGLGLAVYIRHRSGYTTVYGHLNDHNVRVGMVIERGEEIGRVGSTGMSTGPHLHYSVLDRGVPVDPADFCFLLLKAINQQEDAANNRAKPANYRERDKKSPVVTVKRS